MEQSRGEYKWLGGILLGPSGPTTYDHLYIGPSEVCIGGGGGGGGASKARVSM